MEDVRKNEDLHSSVMPQISFCLGPSNLEKTWMGLAAHMREMRNAYKILVRKLGRRTVP
jgi:hypothetical protein